MREMLRKDTFTFMDPRPVFTEEDVLAPIFTPVCPSCGSSLSVMHRSPGPNLYKCYHCHWQGTNPSSVFTKKAYQEKEVVIRPWGKYETIYVGSGFVVKVITVNPGQRLSLQRHRYRDEHWFLVEGTAETSVGQNTEDLLVFTDYSGESTDIPKGRWHRIKNKEQTPLIFIEVQTGNCFEEDIERKEDDYGRVGI